MSQKILGFKNCSRIANIPIKLNNFVKEKLPSKELIWKSIFSLPIVLEIVYLTTLTYLMFSNDRDALKDFNHIFKIIYQNEQK